MALTFMREISLNLIAMIIFFITVSVFFVPLFHLSPTIPVFTTLVLFSLVTVDTLQLRGQGTRLLVDWLEGSSSTQKERILSHEAGHFLIAYLFDIPVVSYALNGWEAFRQGNHAQGGVRFNDQVLMEQLNQGILSQRLCDRYCILWMAGIAAEKIKYNQAEGGEEDREKLRILLTQLKRLVSEIKQKERWAILQAEFYLKTHQVAYENLVEAMRQGQSISQCYEILQEFSPEKS